MYSCPIQRRIVILIFVYECYCVASGVNVERVKCMEIIGWITVLLGRRTRGAVVVGYRIFKIMVSLSRM